MWGSFPFWSAILDALFSNYGKHQHYKGRLVGPLLDPITTISDSADLG